MNEHDLCVLVWFLISLAFAIGMRACLTDDRFGFMLAVNLILAAMFLIAMPTELTR